MSKKENKFESLSDKIGKEVANELLKLINVKHAKELCAMNANMDNIVEIIMNVMIRSSCAVLVHISKHNVKDDDENISYKQMMIFVQALNEYMTGFQNVFDKAHEEFKKEINLSNTKH